MLAALEPQLGFLEELPLARRDGGSLELQHHAPAAPARLELEPRRPARARVLLEALHLGELLHPCLGLARARPGAEAGHEPLHALDLRLLALDARPSASSRAARSLRHACQGPAKKRDRPPSSSSTAVPTASRNQRSCATSTIAASAAVSCSSSHSSDATSRWLVGSSSSSRSGSPASVRASDPRVSSPPEKVLQRPVEIVVGEPEAADHRHRPAAPVIAAGVLQPRLGGRVLVEGRLVGASRRHRLLEPRELVLERDEVGAAGEHVLAEASGPGRAAGAGRGGRHGRPSRATARRRRSASLRRACAAGSSCPSRFARTAPAARRARP